MSKSIIYKATNVKTNKSYIGKTNRKLELRKLEHISRTTHKSKSHFHNSLRKYGPESFIWSILFEGECSNNKLNDLEIFYIGYYDTFNNGYNLTLGGDGITSILDHPWKNLSEEQKRNTIDKGIETKRNIIDPETGLNILTTSAIKAIKTKRNIIDPETGLSIADISNKKGGKSRRGSGNGNKRSYMLIAPNNQRIGCCGGLQRMCDKYNLSFKIIYKNIDKGVIKRKKNGYTTKKSLNCHNWEIISI